jgi:hypothetical protein
MHEITTPAALIAVDERRCWRCLKMFPGNAGYGASGHEEFWLCDPCQAALLPSKRLLT